MVSPRDIAPNTSPNFGYPFKNPVFATFEMSEGLHMRYNATANLTCDLRVTWSNAWDSIGVSSVVGWTHMCGARATSGNSGLSLFIVCLEYSEGCCHTGTHSFRSLDFEHITYLVRFQLSPTQRSRAHMSVSSHGQGKVQCNAL